ncbi:MAG: barstar family protein [Campylobacteraceae bacterium]|jgi:RNAse (barnase) inhibitor barstar|nr:barstar family protein [Campylobacteraceae bacterium]
MSLKEFIIDGNNFSTIKGFYDEVENVFTFNLNRKIGRNLNAFNDILRGGFGRQEYGEPILIKWLNFKKSERNLGADTIQAITKIILDNNDSGHNCILEKL